MTELLDEFTVIPYLVSRGIVIGNLHVELLTGGVSNVVIGIKDNFRDLVLKQALPELAVAGKWVADQRRAIVEAKCMQLLHSLTPDQVPELIDSDPERFTLILARAPRSSTVWKNDLLSGIVDLEVARQLGEILGKWHSCSANNREILDEYSEDSLFDQLRIDPFYRELGRVHSALNNRIQGLILEILGMKNYLVHGDFSPKNILVYERRVTVIDFEVAHAGNPIFDLAFLISHLLCKSFYSEAETAHQISECADLFLESYEKSGIKAGATLGWHVAALALARVDGKSPVHYLDALRQAALREHTFRLLLSETAPTLTEVFVRR